MEEIAVSRARTPARQAFKKRVGTATQHLLTLVVGLSAVEAGATAPPTLPARWDPQSKVDAARRARTFANQATLLWTVESVIAYVSDVRRETPPVLSVQLRESIGNIRDKEEKLVHLAAALGVSDSSHLNLVRTAYVWRNRLTHINARNALKSHIAAALERDAAEIEGEYQGLDVLQMLRRIESNEPPRLKEVTAIVRAAGSLVRKLDERVIEQLNQQEYLQDLIANYLSAPKERRERMQRAVGLWGGTATANARSISNFALQCGLSPSEYPVAGNEIIGLSPRDAYSRFVREEDTASASGS